MSVLLDAPLTWREVAEIAAGAHLDLSGAVHARLAGARAIVEAIMASGARVYGINTGVGALCDVIVPLDQQRELSRSIVFSHAVGVGPDLPAPEVRAIMTAAVNNYAHGHSGVRPVLVDTLVAMLNAGCTPDVPTRGSVGYISHMAQIGLVLIGEGSAHQGINALSGRDALAAAARDPLVLEAKEGLSIVNGTPCATGLSCLALARADRLIAWADAIAALTFESLGGQVTAFGADAMALHRSPGLCATAARLRDLLDGSVHLADARGRRVQDALSLRAVPHVHGAARDAMDYAVGVVDRELGSVSDNPVVYGTTEAPEACSTAHAVGAGLGLAMDLLGIAVAEVAAMGERRLDRLVNPLVSGLPPFLAAASGVGSGFMIAQYAATSLVAENRRLAAPASLDGGVTSALQEDHLSHATPAALKCLTIIDNAAQILGIEWLAAVQATDLLGREGSSEGMAALTRRLRAHVIPYSDSTPLNDDLRLAAEIIRSEACPV